MSLARRFKERHVVQWGLAYLGAAWLVIQVMDALGDTWGVPVGYRRALDVVLGFGLLATLVLAWYHGEKGRQRVSGPELLILAALFAVGGLVVPLVARSEADQATSSNGVPRREGTVAVLPFTDLSADRDQQYFADGLAGEIISALTRDGRVRVAAHTSSFAMRDRSIAEVGEELSVAAVLEGTVRTEGDSIRVTAELVNVADGFQRWSRQFDRRLESVLQVQAEISAAVVTELIGTSKAVAPSPGVIDPVAYDLYLQGRFAWNRRTERDLLESVNLFRAAIDREPGYVRALSGLADAYAVLGFYQYLPPDDAFPEALRLAEQALAVDSSMSEAFATIGYAKTYYEWDWTGAEQAFLRAIELNPRYPVAHQWYGNLLTVTGRSAEAVRELALAAELDPLSLIARAALPWAYHFGRDPDRALELSASAVALDEDFLAAQWVRSMVLLEAGDLDNAIAAHRRAVELSDEGPLYVAELAHALAVAGRTSEAEQLLEALIGSSRSADPRPYEIGKVFLALGRTDDAFDWFERAYQGRWNQLLFLGVDPEVDAIRGDPRFVSLLSRLGLGPEAVP